VIYLLKDMRIVSVLSDNKCAAGSGEFLLQQVRRLGLDLQTAIDRSFGGRVVPLASRFPSIASRISPTS
jgi:activator of 2-hydroxyglutaryl-CoA dehydratase